MISHMMLVDGGGENSACVICVPDENGQVYDSEFRSFSELENQT